MVQEYHPHITGSDHTIIVFSRKYFHQTHIFWSVFIKKYFQFFKFRAVSNNQKKRLRMIGRLYLLPRFIPGLVAVNGMITVIRDSGLINRISRLLGMNLQLGLMYNGKGIVLMNLWFNIPFATMLMAAALSKIPDSTIEAARDAGAERFRILRQMILPLTYRDLFVAATFVFMSNISSFTTPYLMDGNNPQMMGISLYTQFNNGHYEKAAALSVIMFLFSVLSAAVYVYTNMKEYEWEKGNG